RPASDEDLWKYLFEERDFDEVLINGADQIYVDWKGNLLSTPWKFLSDGFLFEKIKSKTKKDSGWSSWREDRLLRIQSALPPTVERPHLCIRKAKQNPFSIDQLI